MATRKVREMGDSVLTKQCKEVTEVTPRLQELIDDMFETLYEENGVGLAAPQVGILKRVVVIDTTGEDPLLLINPKILETSGEQDGYENMQPFEIEGTELLARAICHEVDHLNGCLYVEKVHGPLVNTEDLRDDEE